MSAREVAGRCAYLRAYQWLTGCEAINHHTLSEFRVRHQEALDGLFTQLLATLSSEGLIRLEQVVHDGTKVKASASGNSFHREKSLRRHLAAAQERLSGLLALGGLPQLDQVALRICDPAEPADTLHVLSFSATSTPLARNCASIASRSRTRKLSIVCWARDPK